MIHHNNLNKSVSISQQNTYLFNIISNKKLLYPFFNYLTVSEITKFMLMNKEIYSKFNNPKTYLFYKYMYKRYNSSFIFFDQNKIELRQLSGILKLIKYSDELYQEYYKTQNNFVLVFYIFSFIVLFDIFPILYYFNKKIPKAVIHMPFILIWLLSVIFLMMYFISTRTLNKKINKFINTTLEEIKNDKIIREKLLKNIRRRTKYKKPKGFKILVSVYLISYTPLFFQLIWGLKANVLFKIEAYGVVGLLYIKDFFKFLCIKKKQKNKLNIYEELFSKNQKDLDLFALKKAEIYDKMETSDIGDKMMGFSYYFGVLFLFIVYLSYINMLVCKISDETCEHGWALILIPIDVLGIFITLYTFIFICSIRKLKTDYKWKLIITCIINLICFLVNYVIIPNAGLLGKKSINFLSIIAINIVLGISIVFHFIFLRKFDEKRNEIS